MGAFGGFPAEAVDFYARLEQDNTRAFWTEHRSTYEAAVREPMTALLDDLADRFGAGKVFRPHRDVRFSPDKSPYKTHQGGFVEVRPGIGYYVHLDADGLMAGGGFYAPTPVQVERYRRAVDEERTGNVLVGIVARLGKAGFEIGGDTLKTRPRGYPADHPRIEMLRHRSLTARLHLGAPAWLATPEAVGHVRGAWTAMEPLNTWLGDHLGSPHD